MISGQWLTGKKPRDCITLQKNNSLNIHPVKIAFFDSGVGGLTVLKEAMLRMPEEEYIYYGDSENAPYGTKTKEEIQQLVFRAVEFLSKYELKALVLACNTATSVAVDELRKRYTFPILGMEPAVKLAVKNNRQQKILVCATNLTLKEGKLNQLVLNLNAREMVEYLPLQDLVMYAEHFEFSSPAVMNYLEKKLAPINWNEFDSIVLGCTHFIYFKSLLQKYIPTWVQILDGNEGTVNNLCSKIQPNTSSDSVNTEYFISGKAADPIFFNRYLQFLDHTAKV
jgi:glutamate racemase